MIVCVCKNLNEEKIQELKERYGNRGCLAYLALDGDNCCGTCVKHLKKELTECRTCDIMSRTDGGKQDETNT